MVLTIRLQAGAVTSGGRTVRSRMRAGVCRGIVRLVLTAKGPEYRNREGVERDALVRRVGYTYYTQDFAELVYRELLWHDSKVVAFIPRLHLITAELGNPLAGLFPSHCKNWWPLVEDVFSSPAVLRAQHTTQNTRS